MLLEIDGSYDLSYYTLYNVIERIKVQQTNNPVIIY